MKNLVILLMFISIIGVGGYFAYFWVAPSVSIKNASADKIMQASVHMAKNRLSFDSIEPNASLRIYRGVRQVETPYEYKIDMETGEKINGTCGMVMPNEYFVHFVIELDTSLNVSCERID